MKTNRTGRPGEPTRRAASNSVRVPSTLTLIAASKFASEPPESSAAR